MRPQFRFLLLVLGLCGLLAATRAASAAESTPDQPLIDPQAVAVFEKACAHLAGLESFSFQAEVLLDLIYEGTAKVQVARNMDVTVRRPNAFRIVTTGDDMAATSVFDGKVFTLALPEKKIYGQLPAVMDTEALIDHLAEEYDLESPLGDLMRNSTCTGMHYAALSYLGQGLVGEIRCHHLFFQGEDIDWQLWIEDGPAPLLRKLVITEKLAPLAPQFTAFLRQWDTSGAPPASFAFTPPADLTLDAELFTSQNWLQ